MACQAVLEVLGGVTIRPAIWLAAWVRDLTAERRATESILMASTGPSADFGTAAAWPLSAARAAASASQRRSSRGGGASGGSGGSPSTTSTSAVAR